MPDKQTAPAAAPKECPYCGGTIPPELGPKSRCRLHTPPKQE